MSVKSPTYVNLISSSEEHQNEKTPSPPPRKKSHSPLNVPSKSNSSRSTHYTSSSSPSESPTPTHVAPPPKLCFIIPMKQELIEIPPPQMSQNDPYAQTMDNWPLGPFNPSPSLRVSRPPPGFLNPSPGFEPLQPLQPFGFARFNTIITSLKALDEGFSSKNYIRKFLRALHPKWRAKDTAIEKSKDLSSLALDEIIGNLKVHKVIMEKDSEFYRSKKERIKSIALKAKKESSDDETSTSGSDDEEYAMAAIVQNHLATKIKRPSLEALGVIAKMKPKKKLTMKLVSWLNRQMRGRKPTLEYFKVFGSKFFILNTKDYLTKFDPKLYEGVFLGYSQNSKAYVVLNKHTMKVKESLNVTFDETPPPTKLSPLVDDDVGEEEAIKRNTKVVNNNNEEDESIEVDKIVNIKDSKNHPLDQVIGNLNQRTFRSQAQNHSNFFCFISTIEPKDVIEALKDES
ncbi:retrovirus-related pol polyprotein from transposon TNT 1-94 [Tanacetum coccineum]